MDKYLWPGAASHLLAGSIAFILGALFWRYVFWKEKVTRRVVETSTDESTKYSTLVDEHASALSSRDADMVKMRGELDTLRAEHDRTLIVVRDRDAALAAAQQASKGESTKLQGLVGTVDASKKELADARVKWDAEQAEHTRILGEWRVRAEKAEAAVTAGNADHAKALGEWRVRAEKAEAAVTAGNADHAKALGEWRVRAEKAEADLGGTRKDLDGAKAEHARVLGEWRARAEKAEGEQTKIQGLMGSTKADGDKAIASLRGDLDAGRSRIGELEGQIGGAHQRIAELEGQLGGVHGDLDGARGRIGQLEGELQGLRGEYDGSRHRVAELEGQLGGVNGDLNGARGRISELEGQLGGVNGDLNGARGRISELEGQLGGAHGDLNGARGRIAELEGQLGGVHGDLDGARGRVGQLEAELNGLRGQLDGARGEQTKIQGLLSTTKTDHETSLAALRAELESVRGQASQYESENKQYRSRLADLEAEADSLRTDDLLIIEGIGPKINQALNDDGIRRWVHVRDASEDRLRSAIEKGGIKFAPSINTWSKQAAYLVDGDMDGFRQYTEYLVSGQDPSERTDSREVDASEVSSSSSSSTSSSNGYSVQSLRSAAAEVSKDDLQRIEGIGPVFDTALNRVGIDTFAEVADADEATLTAALGESGHKFAPSMRSWSLQARYLLLEDEDGFAKYTEYLVGGRDPGKYSGPAPVDRRVRRFAGAAASGSGNGGDDLLIIEGIGPKINAILLAGGVNTFRQVATLPEEEIRSIVTAGGVKFAPSLPTWAAQAKYLADGDQKGFEEYVEYLVAGRDPAKS
jgi:predicted flap endonuclease-1-like 5' DNA nuclease